MAFTDDVFPFRFSFDHNLVVREVGTSLAKLCGDFRVALFGFLFFSHNYRFVLTALIKLVQKRFHRAGTEAQEPENFFSVLLVYFP